MQRFIRNIGIVGIANVALYLKGFLLFVIITKIVGVVEFGIWSELLGALKLLTPIAFLGLPAAMIKFMAHEKHKRTFQEFFYSIIFMITFVSIALSFLLFLSSDTISTVFMKDKTMAYLIKILAFFFPIYILCETLFVYFQAILEVKRYVFFLVLTNVIELLLAVLSIYYGFRLLGILLAMMFARAVMLIFMSPIIVRGMGFKLPDFSKLKMLLLFSLPLLPVSFLSWVTDSSDRYLIGFFLDPKAVGIYSAAYVLSSMTMFLTTPITTVFYPTISGLWNKGEKEEFKKYISYVIKYTLICIIPFVAILTSLNKPLIYIFSSKVFFAGNLLVGIICLGLVFYSIAILAIHTLNVFKKTKFVLFSFAVAASINFMLNIIAIPGLGILGAAIATAAAYFALLFLTLSEAMQSIGFQVDIPAILKSIAASIIIALILAAMHPEDFGGIVIGVFISFACYALMLAVSKTANKKELLFLKQLFGFDKLRLKSA